jgi:hypothetical protein
LEVCDVAFHCLFVEAVEAEAFAHGRLLRARADLVDCVERMSEYSVCLVVSVVLRAECKG